MTSDVSALPPIVALRELNERRPDFPVLSVYLDTSPDRLAGEGHRIALVDACKATRHTLDGADLDAFEAAVDQVERYLTTEFLPTHPGVAIFSSGHREYFYAVPLPYRPTDTVTWSTLPRLEPLQAAADEFERMAVLLFDKERARLFTIFIGQLEERRFIEDDVPGKQATGDWFALAQTRYARHHEEHVLRHVARAIDALNGLLRARPFNRLLLGGPPEALALLQRELPLPLQERITGSLHTELFASEADVLKAALEAARTAGRQEELAEISELIEAATSRHVALGVDATLQALGDGRTHELFVADGLNEIAGQCQTCDRLVPAGATCRWCNGPVSPITDLRQRIVDRALGQGAKIETVSGAAGEMLMEHGGLGAWTRY
jgi:peptide chain release factor subunit 1